MIPNSVVLPAGNMNHVNNQQLQNNSATNKSNHQMDKENSMNTYVTTQMNNLSLGSMNTGDLNDGLLFYLRKEKKKFF